MAKFDFNKYIKEKKERLTVLLKKFFAFNSKPTYDEFPELVTIMIWVRFFLGLGYGISMGRSLNYGAVSLLFGLNAIALIPMAYCNLYLQADTDSYGAKLLFGGVHNSVALMMLIWIYYYTCEFTDQENQMIALLVNNTITDTADSGDSSSSDIEGMIDPSTKEVFDENVDDAADSSAASDASGSGASAEAAAQLQQEATATSAMDESEF